MCILKGGPLKAILLIKESNDLNAAFPIVASICNTDIISYSNATFALLFNN